MQKNDYKDTPLWDSSLEIQERIDYLLAQMTLDEKFCFLATQTPAIERLGIGPFAIGGEAAHGVEARHDQDGTGKPDITTSFPQPIGMSASWDTELIKEAGAVVGTQARILFEKKQDKRLCRWAPTVDMLRDPRWGRTEEGYGEDPYLTGEMAGAYIRGMQGETDGYLRISAAVKHFYANNVEEGRVYKSSSIDPRNRMEYYWEPFRRTIALAGADCLMTSYNAVNGIPQILDHSVRKTVKGKWGLKGHVVCDGGAMLQVVEFHHYFGTHSQTLAAALKAGVDSMTDDPAEVEKAAREAYELGLISEADIDRALRCTFGTKLRLSLYDAEKRNPYAGLAADEVETGQDRQVCLDLTRESVVLLKNEKNMLPLGIKEKICVIGPMADRWFSDWYGGVPPYKKTVLDGIKELLGHPIPYDSGLDEVLLGCNGRYFAVNAQGELVLTENKQNAAIFFFQDWGNGKQTLLCKQTGKYVSTDNEKNLLLANKQEPFGWFVKECLHFVPVQEAYGIQTWNGEAVGIDAEGRLCFGKDVKQVVLDVDILSSGTGRAKKLAAEYHTVIFAAGCNSMINSKEEVDRTTLALPPQQEQLVKELFLVNSRMVFVLLSNYPYAIQWEAEQLPAILWMATGSQEMGTAMAQAVYGKNCPAGRLNLTWYRDDAQLPDMDDYDIIKGKRTYRYFDGTPLYPFGYGLTYTEFVYSGLKVKLTDAWIHVEFTVSNTGSIASDEVAQVYGTAPSGKTARPIRQLLGFERLKQVAAGESRTVTMEIPVSEFWYYDTAASALVLADGDYTIEAGAYSTGCKMRETIYIPGVRPGIRRLEKMIAADHYDDYENIILAEGNCGYACVRQGRKAEEGMLLYRNCRLKREYDVIVFNIQCPGQGNMRMVIDGQDCGTWTGAGIEKYMNMEWKLPGLQDKISDIYLYLEGDVRITRFWMRGKSRNENG